MIFGREELELMADNVNKEYLDKVSKTVMDIQAKNSGLEISAHAGSTDCNIPHSLGLPAVCVGIYKGAGVHTREEYLVKDSLKVGVNIMNDLFMEFSK